MRRWMALSVLMVVLGVGAEAPTWAATKLGSVCAPLKPQVIAVPPNPRFVIRHTSARAYVGSPKPPVRGRRGKKAPPRKELPVSSKSIDGVYSEVRVHAQVGATFHLYLGDCALGHTTFVVRSGIRPKRAAPAVRKISFESGRVELAPSEKGWFEVEIADSVADLREGRVYRYYDYVDGGRPLGKTPFRGTGVGLATTASVAPRALSTLEAQLPPRLSERRSAYVLRVRARNYDGSLGKEVLGWAAPNGTWGIGPMPSKIRQIGCSAVARAQRVTQVVPSDAPLFFWNDYAIGERYDYPYARRKDGGWLQVNTRSGAHPFDPSESVSHLYTPKAPTETPFEVGFLPYERPRCRAGGAWAASRTFHFVADYHATWSARKMTIADAWVNDYPGHEGLYVVPKAEEKLGLPLLVEMSTKPSSLAEAENAKTLGSFALRTKASMKKEHLVFVRITPRASYGKADSWTGWVKIDPVKRTFEWGEGLVPGKQVRGSGTH